MNEKDVAKLHLTDGIDYLIKDIGFKKHHIMDRCTPTTFFFLKRLIFKGFKRTFKRSHSSDESMID